MRSAASRLFTLKVIHIAARVAGDKATRASGVGHAKHIRHPWRWLL